MGDVGVMKTLLWIAAIIAVWTLGLALGHTALAADRSTMYPPRAPLWGTTITGAPAVLWTDGKAMFNSNPYDSVYARSHWDDIFWQDGWLTYTGTYAVAPLVPSRVTFTPGIRYAPATGNGTYSGRSWFSTHIGAGVIYYTSKFTDSGWSIRERMFWLTGLNAGYVTDWEEFYELGWIDGKQMVVRTWGGNLSGADRWDITFERSGP